MVVVYVDDIIFSSDAYLLISEFEADMKVEFEMYMLGELSYFLVFQIMQTPKRISISQGKYIEEVISKFCMEECSLVSTPMVRSCKLSKMDGHPEVE